jgi:hypothetical protein
MTPLRYAAAAVLAAAGLVLVASPAHAWDTGRQLKPGDVFCTDQVRSETVRFHGHVQAGFATITIFAAPTAGGAETVAWTQTGVTSGFNKYVSGAPTTHYRGCVTITSALSQYTWAHSSIMGVGPTRVADLGPHTATLSPDGHACGDWGLGPVQLTGTANATVTWYVTAFDQDYGFVGPVFTIAGTTVDTVFTPGPDLSLLELCVHNTSQQTISAAYELSAAV